MNFLLIPFLAFTASITQIKISENQTINSFVIDNKTQLDRKYLALSPADFILVKSIIESTDNDCKDLVTDSIEICKIQVDECYSSCNNIPKQQKNLIRVLKTENKIFKSDIKALKNNNKFLKYVSIVAGSIALSSGVYVVLK
tara:strand:- start:2808 stop:3233 length:426 start_codon:yes stop_codon:yes gene_type:complete